MLIGVRCDGEGAADFSSKFDFLGAGVPTLGSMSTTGWHIVCRATWTSHALVPGIENNRLKAHHLSLSAPCAALPAAKSIIHLYHSFRGTKSRDFGQKLAAKGMR